MPSNQWNTEAVGVDKFGIPHGIPKFIRRLTRDLRKRYRKKFRKDPADSVNPYQLYELVHGISAAQEYNVLCEATYSAGCQTKEPLARLCALAMGALPVEPNRLRIEYPTQLQAVLRHSVGEAGAIYKRSLALFDIVLESLGRDVALPSDLKRLMWLRTMSYIRSNTGYVNNMPIHLVMDVLTCAGAFDQLHKFLEEVFEELCASEKVRNDVVREVKRKGTDNFVSPANELSAVGYLFVALPENTTDRMEVQVFWTGNGKHQQLNTVYIPDDPDMLASLCAGEAEVLIRLFCE